MYRRTTTAFAGASVLFNGGIRDQLRLAWRLLRDERVSSLKYVLPALLTFYVVSPFDPIPDFLLGIGQMDDIGVVIGIVLLLGRVMPRLAPAHVVDEHVQQMRKARRSGAPDAVAESDVIDASFNVRN